jgi:glycosyltransferase involved in cell wall biosynthesis
MSCGCPVCCSNTSSFPEVAGNAASYFDPYNASNMKSSILDVIKNPHLREQMISDGYTQSGKFSWDLTRKQTAAIYKGVV